MTFFRFRVFFLPLLCIILGAIFSTPQTAFAKDPKPTIRDAAYSAKFVSQSHPDPIIMEAGSTKDVTITFKNTGSKTWNSDSSRYISAYTMKPRNRISPFLQKKQTPKIPGITQPGKTGTLSLTLTAPKKTGDYVEHFYLASENNTWMKNGYFFLKITVIPKKVVPKAVKEKKVEAQTVAKKDVKPQKKAAIIGQNKKDIQVKGGDQVYMVLMYQNKGAEPWNGYTVSAANTTALASGQVPSFADKNWKSNTIVIQKDAAVNAKSVLRNNFTFRAPSKKGEYTVAFQLEVDNELVEGSTANVRVHVTENAPLNYSAPTFTAPKKVVKKQEPVRFQKEQRVRVGLTTQGNSVQFISFDDDYAIFNGEEKVGILPRKKIGILVDKGANYTFAGNGHTFATKSFIRLAPINNPHAVFTITKGLKDRRIAWVGPSAFTKYRGAFEYRRGQRDGKMYIVNDLLMEDYVSGIAENGLHTPIEAVKANIVAARTYAFISKNKYPFFDVLGSTYDQLYLGVEVETHLPKSAQAAKATRGQMVTYNNEVVTTPYFGNSSGTTRSWKTVWGGTHKPWLVPVKAKYDAGRRRFGHGVGMSQRDAALRAKKDNWDWKQLLAHYYTNTITKKMYQ
tara:strand:+ start:1417 stop:3282 length:1866 start_codon:yes stop_codon:yes gene_type:complete